MFTSLSYVPLIAPSTTASRIKFLASIADTFIYVVSKVRFLRRHLFILLIVIPPPFIRWVLQDPMKRLL